MDSLFDFLSSIRWQDIVDVLVNSYILFRLYVLFRGTNVIRVVAGIALLWVFQRLAVSLGLIVTSWVMQGIIAGAALIIIIVFRNEIRNVLQTKNLRALVWEFAQKSDRTPIDAIVEGVYDLARHRTGALIVLPGKEDLEDVVKGGVRWGGLVSKQMLGSIFYHGNPVHDGAAVIEGDRVTRVGAILPLSHRDDLPHYYGTRHRAAAGLTEQTDALVIAVSEERGQVVAAKNSTIIDIGDNIALKRVLGEHLGGDSQLAHAARRHHKELAAAAAVCVLCMALVWFSFAKGMETLTSVEAPLEYLNRDIRMQVVSTSTNNVRLYLSGSAALLGSLRLDQIRAKLDLGNATIGKNNFIITRENIVTPPGLRVNRIEPAQVMVELDMPVSRSIPIQVDWSGSLDKGLIMENVTIKPESTLLVGPERLLSKIATIYTDKINLANLTESGQMTVDLALERSALKIGDGYREKVEVKYIIRGRSP